MYNPYFDLRELAAAARKKDALWHDENAVPRWVPFKPGLQDVYADVEALFEVKCQGCGETFMCAGFWSHMPKPHYVAKGEEQDIFKHVKWNAEGTEYGPAAEPTTEDTGWISWGDAPWHGEYQCSGTTMTTCILRIAEYWERKMFDWRRRPDLELKYEDDFAETTPSSNGSGVTSETEDRKEQ